MSKPVCSLLFRSCPNLGPWELPTFGGACQRSLIISAGLFGNLQGEAFCGIRPTYSPKDRSSS